MSTFVLIHGGWAGGWVWEKLTPLLERHGHTAVVPDLPGHGDDRTALGRITLDSYARRVLDAIDAEPAPVVVVGHSSGGAAITQAAEQRPDKIELLVYLAAHLPAAGQSVLDLGRTDTDSLLMANLLVADDQHSAVIRPEALREALFADCPEEDYRSFVERMVAEPLAPAATPVTVTDANFGRIPRAYLECTRDRAVSPDLQRRMYEAVACRDIIALDTGHMPQYAAAEVVAAQLHALVGSAVSADEVLVDRAGA